MVNNSNRIKSLQLLAFGIDRRNLVASVSVFKKVFWVSSFLLSSDCFWFNRTGFFGLPFNNHNRNASFSFVSYDLDSISHVISFSITKRSLFMISLISSPTTPIYDTTPFEVIVRVLYSFSIITVAIKI